VTTPREVTGHPDWLGALITRSASTDGQPPFSDGSLVDLRQGRRRVLTIDDEAAALITTGTDAEREAEFVVDPDARRRGLGTAMLAALLERSPAGLLVWAHGDHPAARRLAATQGLTAVRELLQLRAPVAHATTGGPDDAGHRLDAFRPNRDESAWLDLNARAFASHPEQGAVTRDDLDALMAEPWFDADDFLLDRDGDDLVGYCWLKVENGVGEFYVVGVSPDHQGRGVGRRLVTAGLARLAERGITTASLYVEADNTAAVRLYRSFGFSDHSIDIQYASQAAAARLVQEQAGS
jgi:mycothiol synthase